MKTLTRLFFKGTLVLLPLVATGYVFYLIFAVIDGFGRKILALSVGSEYALTGIGFLLTLTLVLTVGYLSSSWFGGSFFTWLDEWMMEDRFTKGIYGVIRDTVSAMMGRSAVLDKVVLVDFPELGYKRIGFVTQDTPAFMEHGEDQMVIYFPHSFQISGNMIVVPRKNVKFLEMSKETALKMIMSAGIAKK